MDTIRLPGLLLIGGATRNVGKTSFTTTIIRQFASQHAIVGLKIKTLYEGDSFFHGKDRNPLDGDYRITEETDTKSTEDTSRMLAAGAQRVFKIKTKATHLAEAFAQLQREIQHDGLWICESNSLREAVIPDLFLLIKHQQLSDMKPSAKRLQRLADQIVWTDGERHLFNFDSLKVENGCWIGA